MGKLKLVKGKSVTWAENATSSIIIVLVTLLTLPFVSSFTLRISAARGEQPTIFPNNSICRLFYFSWDFLFSVPRYG